MSTSELTERQKALLKMIIEEYIVSAEPISSSYLTEKFNLNISAATIRNEMAELIRKGYLEQPHISAGRVPSQEGYRLYIQELMEAYDLPVLKEVAMKQNVYNNRYEIDKFLHSAAHALSDATGLMSIVSTTDGRVFSSGMVNILDHREFFDIDVSRAVLNLIDNYSILEELLNKRNTTNICVILGEEFERKALHQVSVVTKSYTSGSKKGNVMVLGPSSMEYKRIIPTVSYMSGILQELGADW